MRPLGAISLSKSPLAILLLFCSSGEGVPSPLSGGKRALPHEDDLGMCLARLAD